MVTLDDEFSYVKMRDVKWVDVQEGDRFIFYGRTWEVTERPSISISGRSYRGKYRAITLDKNVLERTGYRMNDDDYYERYLLREMESLGHEYTMSGHVDTKLGRVVHRPASWRKKPVDGKITCLIDEIPA